MLQRRSSAPVRPLAVAAALGLLCLFGPLCAPSRAITPGRPSGGKSAATELDQSGARALVVVIPSVTWSQLRAARLPHLRSLLDKGVGALMPAQPTDITAFEGMPPRPTMERIVAGVDGTALRDDVRHALGRSQMVVVDLGDGGRSQSHDLLESADALIGDAASALRGREALAVLVSPSISVPKLPLGNSNLGFVVLAEIGGRDDVRLDQLRSDPKFPDDAPSRYLHWLLDLKSPGMATSAGTRWAGLITPADLPPTLLAWWGEPTPSGGKSLAAGRVLNVEQDTGYLSRLDHIDRVLTDRYRIRIPMAKWYVLYGLLAVAAGAVAASKRRHRLIGAAALGIVFVPVGLAVAAPIPPGHDALYLAASFAIALALGLVAAIIGRRDANSGLALTMLLGAALIVADVLNGSPLMRFSALEMGIMMGSRFYGVGNEYMGALAGMTMIGLGAMVQRAPNRGRLAALIGVFVTLVIGLGCWGANWGGSVTAAVGLLALWLISIPRVTGRHLLAAAALFAASIIVPAALDLLNAPQNRSHIGASAAALLSGDTAGLADTIVRKIHIALKVLRTAPLSVLGAALCALVFWLQLRPGAPARRALAGQRFLTAGIVAALVVFVVATLAEDSGPAAGLGAILAALGAVVFLASNAPEVAA